MHSNLDHARVFLPQKYCTEKENYSFSCHFSVYFQQQFIKFVKQELLSTISFIHTGSSHHSEMKQEYLFLSLIIKLLNTKSFITICVMPEHKNKQTIQKRASLVVDSKPARHRISFQTNNYYGRFYGAGVGTNLPILTLALI